MNYSRIDYANKKNKWTVMKYVASLDLLLQYVELMLKIGVQIDDRNIDAINREMQEQGIYRPRAAPSRDTQYFKIIQICNNMFAYRGKDSAIVFTPLCHMVLRNKDDAEKKGKIIATMLSNLPYSHPYNKMDESFDLFPYRLIYKLLLDPRLHNRLYLDDVFYLVGWTKQTDASGYGRLVDAILSLRGKPPEERLKMFSRRLPVQDSLANMLHETMYLFEQLESAGIVDYRKGRMIGVLHHGGFGRGAVPDVRPSDYKPTGNRKYSDSYVSVKPEMMKYLSKLLEVRPFDEKPKSILENLGTQDFILKLWNSCPNVLLDEIGESVGSRTRINFMTELTNDIRRYSKNSQKGDCYKFETILCDAFNEFSDIEAQTLAKSGTTDIECVYLTLREKFDVEAKSSTRKLSEINSGRLALHRRKICSKYTIVVAPNYVPSVLSDIRETDNVILTATSLCNFLYQSSLHSSELTYSPIREIIAANKGCDISRKLDDYVSMNYGIKKGTNEDFSEK